MHATKVARALVTVHKTMGDRDVMRLYRLLNEAAQLAKGEGWESEAVFLDRLRKLVGQTPADVPTLPQTAVTRD